MTLAGTWNVSEAYPEWFGAKGDGVTDDSGSFQKCFGTFKVIKLASKTYLLDNPVTILSNNTFKLTGEEGRTEVLVNTKGIIHSGETSICLIQGITFKPKDSSNGTETVISLGEDPNLQGAVNVFISRCRFISTYIGIASTGECDCLRITDCHFLFNRSYSINISSSTTSSSIVVDRCHFQMMASNTCTIKFVACHNVTVSNSIFQSAGRDYLTHIYVYNSTNVDILNNYFEASGTTTEGKDGTSCVEIRSSSYVSIQNFSVVGTFNSVVKFSANSSCEFVVVKNIRYQQAFDYTMPSIIDNSAFQTNNWSNIVFEGSLKDGVAGKFRNMNGVDVTKLQFYPSRILVTTGNTGEIDLSPFWSVGVRNIQIDFYSNNLETAGTISVILGLNSSGTIIDSNVGTYSYDSNAHKLTITATGTYNASLKYNIRIIGASQ